MNTSLQEHLADFSTNPYLFIGSGLSRRYLSLPTWEQLLIDFFAISNIDGDYEYHRSKSDGDLPLLASNMAKEFHETWWKTSTFKKSREEFKVLAQERKDIPFKIELSQLVSQRSILNKKYSKEIELLKTSVIDGIITTNWDSFFDGIFSDYKIYIGQQELLFSEGLSIGEIYKIHGCISKPPSLVVTAEDYLNFNERNAYLAAKLLTIFVEHPIIFFGYSLSDENIIQIIDSIVKCVEAKNLHKLKDRLIFVEWRDGVEFEMRDSSMMLPGKKVLPIKLITTDSFEPIFSTLSTLKRQIPIKILRKLRNSVIELVKSSKPSSKVFVKDINTIDDATDIEYAIGVGVASQFIAAQGYKAIDASDLIEDILFDNKDYDVPKLFDNTFPSLMKGNAYIPIFKYLKAMNYLNKGGNLNLDGTRRIKDKFKMRVGVPECFQPPSTYMKKKTEIRNNHKDIKSLIKNYDKEHAILFIPLLEHKNIDLKTLKIFLSDCFKDSVCRKNSNFRKLVCLYDYLKYAQPL